MRGILRGHARTDSQRAPVGRVPGAVTQHREIDVHFQGQPHAVCCHQIGGYLVDPGPESCVSTLLDALGDEAPRGVLLTHIHLDHAGATGALVERWPDLPVWVHARGARHVVDPSKLVASATRIYGDRMEQLWGRIVPVPEANVRVLGEDGGAAVPDGFRWAYTPGHAVHHVSYLHEDSGIAFAGDVAGVKIGSGPVLPPTPPPDIDVEAWMGSIATIGAWKPAALAVTHFGTHAEVQAHLGLLVAELKRLSTLAELAGEAAFEAAIRKTFAGLDEEAAYLAAMPPETLYGGLARYWRNRDTPQST
jgi:glyoxylase-like metal-dependent hydrolase (beta-lactamase superfamily II)